MAVVSTRPGSTSTEGCLFDDDRCVIGVGITDTGGEASVISVTVCSVDILLSDLSPAAVVTLNGKAFCAKMDGEACIVPDTEADLIK
jgi:hypothetical protein